MFKSDYEKEQPIVYQLGCNFSSKSLTLNQYDILYAALLHNPVNNNTKGITMAYYMPMKRKYNAPNFLDWLLEQEVYDVVWFDIDDPDDDTLVISYEATTYIIENLHFMVRQDQMSLTIEIIDAQPDTYDDFWTAVIDRFHSELPTNLSGEKLPPLNVTLEYTFDFSALIALSDKK